MNFEDNLQSRVDYFRKSVRLDSKATESDPEYDYSDNDLLSILEYSSLSLWGMSVKDIPPSNFPIVLVKSKLEVYMRLATTTAPFYEISAEGASLKKNMRFDHYDRLIKRTQDEFDKLYAIKFGKGNGDEDEDKYGVTGALTTYNVSINHIGRKYGPRNLGRADFPLEIESVVYVEDNDSLEIEWTPYSYLTHSPFRYFEIFCDTKPIVDKFDPDYKSKKKPLAKIEDGTRSFYRIGGIESENTYYIAIKAVNVIGEVIAQEKVKIPAKELIIDGLSRN